MKTAALPPSEPNYLSTVKWAIVAAILFAFILHFSGCSPLPKAIQRVETNENSFNKVGADWARLHPCVTDSVVRVSHDTVTVSDTSYSGLVSHIPIDSFFTTATTGANQPNVILRGGENPLGWYADKGNPTYASSNRQTGGGITRTITKTITIHDSVKVTTVDERVKQMLTDSLYSYKLALAGAKGASDTIVSQTKHSLSRWRIIALVAISALLLIVGFKVYHFFKLGGLKALFTNI